MSHMGTSHVGQIGWLSLEDVSVLGTVHVLSQHRPENYFNIGLAT
jgi:hypothetical protein